MTLRREELELSAQLSNDLVQSSAGAGSTHIHTYIHTYIHTVHTTTKATYILCIHTYIHSFIHTYNLFFIGRDFRVEISAINEELKHIQTLQSTTDQVDYQLYVCMYVCMYV